MSRDFRPGQMLLALGLALPLVVGCERLASGPTLDARWIGRDTGRFEGRARAVWCAGQRRLQVTAVSGDAGVGLVLYPADSLGPVELPVSLPDSAPARPGAAVALRFFTQTLIKGYQADSGTVSLKAGPGNRWDARFAARMLNFDRQDTVHLTGLVRAVSPVADPERCPEDSLPADAPGQ